MTSPLVRVTGLAKTYSAWGENVAMGYPSPRSVVRAWMRSAGHRANILNPAFRHVGVGLRRAAAAAQAASRSGARICAMVSRAAASAASRASGPKPIRLARTNTGSVMPMNARKSRR